MSARRGSERWHQLYDVGLIAKQICDESSGPRESEHIPAVILYLAKDEATVIYSQVLGTSRRRVAVYSDPMELKDPYKDGVWTVEELLRRIPSTLA